MIDLGSKAGLQGSNAQLQNVMHLKICKRKRDSTPDPCLDAKFKIPLSRGPILALQCETRGRFEPYSWKYRAKIWSLHITTWKSHAKLQTRAAARLEIKRIEMQTGTRESCSTLSWGCRVGAHQFEAGNRCGMAGSTKWKGIFLQVLEW